MVFTTRLAGGKGGRNAFEAELRRLGITQKDSPRFAPTLVQCPWVSTGARPRSVHSVQAPTSGLSTGSGARVAYDFGLTWVAGPRQR
jgi:hypothetical protein